MLPPQRISSPRWTVFLVEDAPCIQQVLSEVIEAIPGLELVGVADSVAKALVRLAQHMPNVVIVDLVLRDGTGFEVLRAVKQRTSSCQVLVFTGHDAEQYRTRCLANGADHFFSKARQGPELANFLRNLAAKLPAIGSAENPSI